MEPSFRIVPASTPKSASVRDTAGSLGLHDTLVYGPRSLATEVRTDNDASRLRQRLESWEETQDNLKLTMQRNIYGLHAPVRMLMERKLVSHNPHMPAMPQSQSNLHLDILMGRDEFIETPDVFLGAMPGMQTSAPMDIHNDMEKKLRM